MIICFYSQRTFLLSVYLFSRLFISESEDKIEDFEDETMFALVINGHSLVHALHIDLEKSFIELCSNCKYILTWLVIQWQID